jgi:hypothetical protein
MVASAIRNMQVPAYWPAPFGVHAIENRGVEVKMKKVMAMSSMPIMLDDDMPMVLVELGLDIPDMVGVGVPDMAIDMLFMSMVVES